MITAPKPTDEAERLADLRALQILDTPPEERFDRLVRLAGATLATPIAYIALVDENRQWFKSRCGLEPPQTDRAVSFCGHTILRDEPLVIPDALSDPRFHDNPMVTGAPFIRFYAGHPLRGPGGRNVGTFCIADTAPRDFDDGQLAVLRDLAAAAEHELNLHDLISVQHELLETQGRLLATQRRLADELSEAAEYVKALLPRPLGGPVRTDWLFVASSELGGDLFGYHWLDARRLAIYLLDVCGHGVGASLMASAVFDTLRGESLADVDFDDPAAVLAGLNAAYQMEDHAGRFLTAWYGVLDIRARRLRFASAGHPPALLRRCDGAVERLRTAAFPIGIIEDATYENDETPLLAGDRLYLFSDGAYEVADERGSMLEIDGLERLVAAAGAREAGRVAAIRHGILSHAGREELGDDFSLLEVELAQGG